MYTSIAILRSPSGFDFTSYLGHENCSVAPLPAESNAVVIDVDAGDDAFVETKGPDFTIFQPDTAKTPDSIINELNRFSTEQPKGTIDGKFNKSNR